MVTRRFTYVFALLLSSSCAPVLAQTVPPARPFPTATIPAATATPTGMPAGSMNPATLNPAGTPGSPGAVIRAAATAPAPGVWKPATADKPAGAPTDPTQPPLKPIGSAPRAPIAKVTKGPGTLPNDGTQEWRDYDISPYTTRVTSTNRPEQAIVDWVLRETGYEAWHGEPLGLLSANRRVLRVYHTPEMHAVVGDMVDRFVNTETEAQAFGLLIITVDSPNWRARAQRMLRPVSVQSHGVQAWLLAREDAALVTAELRKRTDYREQSSPHMLVSNGQAAVVSTMRPRQFIRDVMMRGDAWPGYEPQMGQVDEGFSLEFSPLLSLDGKTIDAIIKCNVEQIEKMVPVTLDVPTTAAPRQRTKVEVPQVTGNRFHERFRWPADQVLLISLGMVAVPTGVASNPLAALSSGNKAELLVFVEARGKLGPTGNSGPVTREANIYRGRY